MENGGEKATSIVVEEHGGSASTVNTVSKHVEWHDTQRSTVHRKPRHVDVKSSMIHSQPPDDVVARPLARI